MVGETYLKPNNEDTIMEPSIEYSYLNIYDANGRVMERQSDTTWLGHSDSENVTVTRYSYDSKGRVQSVRSAEIPKTLCNPQGNPDLDWDDPTYYHYDYAPLVLIQSGDRYTIELQDSVGQTIWSQYLGNDMLDIDAEGYIVGSTDTDNEKRCELIYGDGNAHSETIQTQTLTYPISEELCHVIFERRFGHPMENGTERVKVSRLGSGDNERISFEFYLETDTLTAMPEFYFIVYVNTGKCEEGVPTGHNFIFNAEDYF